MALNYKQVKKRTINHRLAQLLDERHRLPLQTPREPNQSKHKSNQQAGSDQRQPQLAIVADPQCKGDTARYLLWVRAGKSSSLGPEVEGRLLCGKLHMRMPRTRAAGSIEDRSGRGDCAYSGGGPAFV